MYACKMFAATIVLAALLLRSLEAIIVDSYYMPATPKEQVDTFAPRNLRRQQFQSAENEIDYADPYPTTKPLYKYGYSVFDPYTMDVKSQWEHRDGDVVRGAYNMLEADGSLRIVEYTSDKDNGFRAIVKKIPFYLDTNRRPVETFPRYSKPPPNQYQEAQSPDTYNEPFGNYVGQLSPQPEQPSSKYSQPSHPNHGYSGNQVNHQYHNQYKQHQSENYVQRENYHKHYPPKQSKPIQVYKRLLPILR